MDCGCIKNYFDASVIFTDCAHIEISDRSEWMSGGNYTHSSYMVELKLGSGKAITKEISAGSPITVSADEFGLSCFNEDYIALNVESCGVKYSKKKALICDVECKVKSLLASAVTTEQFNTANLFMLKIEAIKLNLEYGRDRIANDILQAVKSQLKTLDCNAHCGC